jgi:aminodeoxyfutalosine deaminase
MVTEHARRLSDTPAEGVDMLWRLPKVELHLHLVGTIRPATVCAQARRYAPDSPFCHDGWQAGFWSFGDLTTALAALRQVREIALRSADDYYLVARECFEDLAAQQVLYAEVSVGHPKHPPGHSHYVSLPDTLAAIEQARREVEAYTPLRVGLILGLNRGPDDASVSARACQWVEEAVAARDCGAAVVGVDLAGDEQVFPNPRPFVAAFRLAAQAGLGRRAHAGEAAGATSVWDCLHQLDVQRIAHGVQAIEDPALVAHLAQAGVVLDVCPTCNVRTGLVPAVAAHPIRALHEAGVRVTVSSDDPLLLATTVTEELAHLHRDLGFSLRDLGQFMVTAAAHSFQPAPVRATLVRTLQDAWPS